MKILNKQRLTNLTVIAGLLFGTISCSDDYFNPEPFPPIKDVDVSTYNYLAGQKKTFSMFVEIIDATDYKDSVNISGATVLGVNNEAVNNFLVKNKFNSVNDVEVDQLKALMGKYVFRRNLSTDSISSVGQTEESVSGYPLLFKLRRDAWKGVEGVGSTIITVSDSKNPDTETDDVVVKIATSDIKTVSGIVLVFGNDHVFGF